MINKLGQLVDYIMTCAKQHNASPFSRVIVREGANGPEREIEQVCMRTTLLGPEVILQVAERPTR
jgi:hypothetical protein